MGILTSIKRLLEPQVFYPVDDNERWLQGYNALESGREKFLNQEYDSALIYLDLCLKCEFKDASIPVMRATCLDAMDWKLDAIDVFSEAIAITPHDCNLYFQRALCQNLAGNKVEALLDMRNAIELSKIENDMNRQYDKFAVEMGHRNGITSMYEIQFLLLEGIPSFIMEDRKQKAHSKGRRST